MHKLQEDLSVIEDCRGIEFEVLAPVLERAKPETLIHIEEHNPYLMESTGTDNENTVGIWLADIQNWIHLNTGLLLGFKLYKVQD